MGVPNDTAFQTRVLKAALNLFDTTKGPVLVDFPEDAPVFESDQSILACPVNFAPPAEALSEIDALRAAFKAEVAEMRNWYDLAVAKNRRTTFGVSGMELSACIDFIGGFLDGTPDNPRSDLALGLVLNLAVDDVKAYYYEAACARPGQEKPSGRVLNDWFWGETTAGKVLYGVQAACLKSSDPMLNLAGKLLLVPMSHTKPKK